MNFQPNNAPQPVNEQMTRICTLAPRIRKPNVSGCTVKNKRIFQTKNKKMEQLSILEATKRGYKYATPEHGEGELIPFSECEVNKSYFLVSKEGNPFSISDDVIKDLVDDYLCNQDEVSDEDGYLNDLAATVDYSEITKKMNEAFSVRKYFSATKIKLVV